MKTWLRRHLLFVVLVLVPTAGSILYYGIFASDIYVSESRYLVRSPQQSQQTGGLASMLMLGGMAASHSSDDTYAVRDYITSRDALTELQSTVDIRTRYSTPDANIIDRFPGLRLDDSFEQFYRYYGRHVGIDYDPVTGISVLNVRAFRAEDAYRINVALLDMSERLVNTLNDRMRNDTIRYAENEVKIASEKAKDAAVAMLNYRNNQSVFEPNKQATIELEGLAKIQQELIATEAAIAELRQLSPDNPQIGGLNSRAESLRSAIAAQGAKVTGAGASFSTRAANFERLTLDVEFADKQLGMELAELENARSKAMQKQLYLERLVQPNLPDKAVEPRRIVSIIAMFVMSLVLWAVASVLVASVREHAD